MTPNKNTTKKTYASHLNQNLYSSTHNKQQLSNPDSIKPPRFFNPEFAKENAKLHDLNSIAKESFRRQCSDSSFMNENEINSFDDEYTLLNIDKPYNYDKNTLNRPNVRRDLYNCKREQNFKKIPANVNSQKQPETEDKRTLYVGQLHKDVNEAELEELFKIFGTIICCKLHKEQHHKSYCFIEFMYKESARASKIAMNNRKLHDVNIEVKWANTNSSNYNRKKLPQDKFGIFVGDIPAEYTNEKLKILFDQHYDHVVDARIVLEPLSGRSKQYGFVNFTAKSSAEKAINDWNNKLEIEGRLIRLGWADRSQRNIPTKSYEEITKLPNYTDTNTIVYIGGVKDGVSAEKIRALFQEFGEMKEVRPFADKGYAFIVFKDHRGAQEAIRFKTGTQIEGHTIRCAWGRENSIISSGDDDDFDTSPISEYDNDYEDSFHERYNDNFTNFKQMSKENAPICESFDCDKSVHNSSLKNYEETNFDDTASTTLSESPFTFPKHLDNLGKIPVVSSNVMNKYESGDLNNWNGSTCSGFIDRDINNNVRNFDHVDNRLVLTNNDVKPTQTQNYNTFTQDKPENVWSNDKPDYNKMTYANIFRHCDNKNSNNLISNTINNTNNTIRLVSNNNPNIVAPITSSNNSSSGYGTEQSSFDSSKAHINSNNRFTNNNIYNKSENIYPVGSYYSPAYSSSSIYNSDMSMSTVLYPDKNTDVGVIGQKVRKKSYDNQICDDLRRDNEYNYIQY